VDDDDDAENNGNESKEGKEFGFEEREDRGKRSWRKKLEASLHKKQLQMKHNNNVHIVHGENKLDMFCG
jgi:hypothetical protein